MKSVSLVSILTAAAVLSSFSPCFAKVLFYESFNDDYSERWTSTSEPTYEGVFNKEKVLPSGSNEEDFGLHVSEKAKKYGISAVLPNSVTFSSEGESPVVLQYDVRMKKGLDCGGAYLKFLMPQAADWSPERFNSESPYSVMFGPDKCGTTNKVHFIFRHKSPKAGEYIEHHVKTPPFVPTDKHSHVYTAVVYPFNNTVILLVDGEQKTIAGLLTEDFKPAVLPPKTIPDPEDKKPEDWDERPRIPDPEASKPEDWDEEAPKMVDDLDAVKPEGWLDDEPMEIDDPEAVKPEDWDEEEDGEWEAPQVPNPKCEEVGCGEWKRPMKKNPEYKGKWKAPMIDNPGYKGKWAPSEIPNPDYFEIERPNIEPIAAVGVEIWTMNDGILFDNILISDSVFDAEEIRKKWEAKARAEEREEEAEKEKEKKEKEKSAPKKSIKELVFDVLYRIPEIPFLAPYKAPITDLIERGEDNPEVTYGILISIAVILFTTIYALLPSGRKVQNDQDVGKAKKEDTTGANDDKTEDDKDAGTASSSAAAAEGESAEGEEKEEEEGDDGGKVRRRTRRDS